jgi:hypothetical protein
MASRRSARRTAGKQGGYRLQVPVDASGVGALEPGEDQDLKVLVRDQAGAARSATVTPGKDRKAVASFDYDEPPGSLTVMVGPAVATDEELAESQTITVTVGTRAWGDRRELTLAPVIIAPYWWFWWLRWCREFVIRGRVVCPDGSPVPGAEVCAYDVDWWFLWSSTQLAGCATTDVNGAFEIRFRWCCGFWPWWWWRHRVWQLDPVLLERIGPVLATRPELELGRIENRPSLAVLEGLLKEEGVVAARSLEAADAPALDTLRRGLLEKLPVSEELTRLHVWPWWPWWPWWDCTPDIIFKVTQQCSGTALTTIVDEGIWDTRWNIPNPLDVTLVATDEGCCRPIDGPEGECLVVDGVCGIPLANVGGNLGAPGAPAGYAYPGAVPSGASAYNGDRPFGGAVTITKNPGDLVGVDYIELEVLDPATATWGPLPMGAELGFQRQYWEPGGTPQMVFPNFPVQTLSGHRVWETREHFEVTSGAVWFPAGGWTRVWLSLNYSLLAYLDTSKFGDGTYEFRAVGWNDGGGGTLDNPHVIPICGTDEDNRFVLTFDNRVVTPVGHDPTHNCGGVHTCTLEPDTHILDVRIDGSSVNPCDTVEAKGSLEIDFEVTDPDGHLAVYSLIATWGLNNSVNLLPLGTLTALTPGAFEGPTYGEALGQGATAPGWDGGRYRLTIPSAASAFQEPCCYQLELRASKRTIVSCSGGHAHHNLTEYSIGVGIC